MSTLIDEETGLLCPRCGEIKTRSEWRPSDLEGRARGWCRQCSIAYEKEWRDGRPEEVRLKDRRARTERQIVRDRRFKESDPKGYMDRQRFFIYRITPDRFDQMVIDQLGICANPRCDQPLDHIDHDHLCCPTEATTKSCGECIRGLLCRECNLTLGNARDSIERLQGLVEYLRGGQ